MDETALERLRDAVGDDAYLEIIEAYVKDSAGLLDALEAAAGAGDAAAIAFSAHQLRSGSLLLGLVDLDAMASELEQRGLAGSVEGAAELLTAMRVAHAEATTALQAADG